jgi:GAF domain-containing protein/HAMP domain-containing protein
MNRAAFAFLKLSNYPIWLKLALLVGVALLAIAIPTLLTVRSATLESGYETAQRFVQLSSAQRAANIRDIIDSARNSIQSALNDTRIRQDFLAALIPLIDGTPQIEGQVIGELLPARLLDPATTQFSSLRFISRAGVVVFARASTGETLESMIDSDESSSATYTAGLTIITVGDENTIVFGRENEQTFIDVVTVLTRRNGETLGLLVGRLNTSILQSSLSGQNIGYPLISYLAGEDAILAPGASPEGALAPNLSSPGAVRAIEGETGMTQYRLPNGEQTLGYYTPIRDGEIGFVSEIALAAIEAQSVAFFTARAFSISAAFLALGAFVLGLLWTLNQQLAPPILRLRKAAQALGKGDFSTPLPDSMRGDEIGSLASSFALMRDQVESLVGELQNRLEARARDIDTTQEISRFTATQRDLQSLLDRICGLLVERFPNIYHAQVFMLDAEGKSAVLQASTGDAGKLMLTRGHRLAVGSISLVGQAVEQRSMMLARDIEQNGIFRPNPMLPETRAELALPLFFRETVIGVLDVQSKALDAFTGEQVSILQTIANQVAVGIQTAQLYEQSVRRLEQIEEANRKTSAEAWREHLRAQRTNTMSASAGRVPQAIDDETRRAAYTTGKPIVGAATPRQTLPIAIPILVSGQTIGTVEWEVSAEDFDENTMELAQELAKRLAILLENARLFQESRRAAERERMVNDIAARLTAQNNVHEILQTAVREVGQALRTPQVSIRLHGAIEKMVD